MQIGIERFIEEPPGCVTGARLGLLMNQASVDRDLELSCDLVERQFPGQLRSIFSPQHGIWGEQQDNMIETGHATYSRLGVPLFSLYSETRRPTSEMLEDIDCLIVDLQDVGTRVYTFIWSMLECLIACGQAGKSVVVLDRPNPIGGEIFEGPMLDPRFKSFVGNAEIPLRHGLTIAELAQLFVRELEIDVQLHCVPMRGWKRSMFFGDTSDKNSRRNWVWPSPNMPTEVTSWIYPGQVLLEGVNLSEGRGTTRPFEVAGAPFLDPDAWLAELECLEHPGLVLRATRFIPVFNKWANESCGGIDVQVVDPKAVRSVATTVAMLATAATIAPDEFRWLDPPYEYEYEKPPIDILFGSAALRESVAAIKTGSPAQAGIADLLAWDEEAWKQRIEPILMYA